MKPVKIWQWKQKVYMHKPKDIKENSMQRSFFYCVSYFVPLQELTRHCCANEYINIYDMGANTLKPQRLVERKKNYTVLKINKLNIPLLLPTTTFTATTNNNIN